MEQEKPQRLTTGYGTSRAVLTLIEMLVVIAIIAILAALLMPTFSKYNEIAKRAICMNNQLVIGCLAYASDFHNFWPHGSKYNTGLSVEGNKFINSHVFDLLISEYFEENKNLWTCPNLSNKPSFDSRNGGSWGLGYFYNASKNFINKNKNTKYPERIGQSPRVLIFADLAWWNPPWPYTIAPHTPSGLSTNSKALDPRLLGHEGSNCAFYDGHVAWIEAGCL